MQLPLANAGAYVVATLVNYLLNYYWAFRSSRTHAEAGWRFLSVVIFGLVLNSVYVSFVVGISDMPLEVVALSFAVLWPLISFSALKLWALR